MQITATFGSVEEMQEFAALMAGKTGTQVQAGKAKDQKRSEPEQEQKQERKSKKTPSTELEQQNPDEEGAAPWDGAESESEPEETAYTLEEVRAKLAELQKAGKRAEVKALLSSFGVSKLSEVPAARYAALMVKAGEI